MRRRARAPKTWPMRWPCGCGGWKPSAASPSACWRARNSIATCSAAASRSRSPTSRLRNGRRRSTICSPPIRSSGSARRVSHIRFAKRTVWSLAEAREVLERLVGQSTDWTRLDEFLIAYVVEPALAPTVLASSFATTLEMVREGLRTFISSSRSRRSMCASIKRQAMRRVSPARPAAPARPASLDQGEAACNEPGHKNDHAA